MLNAAASTCRRLTLSCGQRHVTQRLVSPSLSSSCHSAVSAASAPVQLIQRFNSGGKPEKTDEDFRNVVAQWKWNQRSSQRHQIAYDSALKFAKEEVLSSRVSPMDELANKNVRHNPELLHHVDEEFYLPEVLGKDPGFPEIPSMVKEHKPPCFFCSPYAPGGKHNPDVPRWDAMNIPLLVQFMTPTGRILPKRITGTCAKHQRALSRTIRRAEHLGFLSHKNSNYTVRSPYLTDLGQDPTDTVLPIGANLDSKVAPPQDQPGMQAVRQPIQQPIVPPSSPPPPGSFKSPPPTSGPAFQFPLPGFKPTEK